MPNFTAVRTILNRLRASRTDTASLEPESPRTDLPYVFVIGFNKTATTTIHRFFEHNGFPSIHWDGGKLARTMLDNCLSDHRILTGYDENYRVFSDMVIQTLRIRFEANSLFRILDTDYPESYFIYNHRNVDAWIASRWKKNVGRYRCTNVDLEMRHLNTREPCDVVEKWREERADFEREVRAYFTGNPRFMEIDIADADAPRQISALLGMDLDISGWGHYKTNFPLR
jgi:hypothetical protein